MNVRENLFFWPGQQKAPYEVRGFSTLELTAERAKIRMLLDENSK
jgi:hypothetical protein